MNWREQKRERARNLFIFETEKEQNELYKSLSIPGVHQSALFDFLREDDEVQALVRSASDNDWRDIRRIHGFSFGGSDWAGLPPGPGSKHHMIPGLIELRIERYRNGLESGITQNGREAMPTLR
jgi:hypothetical protein